MDKEQARDQAWEIHGWLQSACMDMAEGNIGSAEDMYEDVDVLQDLLGDRTIDAAKGDRKDYSLILEELIAIERTGAVKEAASRLLRRNR